MSDIHSDGPLQHDLHLKPLDNAALLKPLQKTKAANRAAAEIPSAPAPRAFAPAEKAPAAAQAQQASAFNKAQDDGNSFGAQKEPYYRRTPQPAPAPVPPPASKAPVPAAAPDDDDDDVYALHKQPTRRREPDPTPAPKAPAPPPVSAVAQNTRAENADDTVKKSWRHRTPAAPAPAPAPASAAEPAAPMPAFTLVQDDDDDEDDFWEPLKSQEPANEPAPAPATAKPAYPFTQPPHNGVYGMETPDRQPAAPAAPATAPAAQPPAFAAQPPAAQPAVDDDEDEETTENPASPPAHAFRPTDEQLHMIELMKSIFATALSADPARKPAADTAANPEPPSMGDLRIRLTALQQKIREAKIPVVIVLEGMSASGKGTMLSRLVEGLDSRGYASHPVRQPNCVEKNYPPMWRYWTQMPAKGMIALFCSSWYGELNKAAFAQEINAETLRRRLDEIISMESQLVCDGTLILKFFLNISQQEQLERLKKMEQKKSTAWLVDAHDHEQNKRHGDYMKSMDSLMSATSLKGAPWHVIDAANPKSCAYQIYLTVIQAFEEALAARESGAGSWDLPMLPNLTPLPSLGFPPSHTIDLQKHLEVPYRDALRNAKKRLAKLQIKLYRKGIPLIIGFEGWDAAGKGGAISRLNAALDARGFTVAPISAPTPTELSHHYLWRFWQALPPKGHITIFDRTWYGRVMVERIEGLCTKPQWQRAFEEINRFEKLLTDDGAILCKFWLQIDPDTQLQRFEERKADPEKQWKLTDDDWRNRAKWSAYEQALDEVLQRTHTACAPWTVVEANDKEYARIKVMQTVIEAIEKRLDDDDED